MTRTLYPTQDAGPTNWSAASWSLADDNAKNQAKPDATDTVIVTVNSGAITLDEDGHGLQLTMTGYTGTLAMGANDLDIVEDVALDGAITGTGTIYSGGPLVLTSGMSFDTDITIVMDAPAGSSVIYTNGVPLGPLVINGGAATEFDLSDDLSCGTVTLTEGVFQPGLNLLSCTGLDIDGGTFTAGEDVTVNGNFSIDGGTLELAGNKLIVDGSCIFTGGTFANDGGIVRFVGTGNLAIWSPYIPYVEFAAGSTMTVTGTSRIFSGIDVEAGATLVINASFYVCYNYQPNDSLHCEGDVSGVGPVVIYTTEVSNSPVLDFGSVNVEMFTHGGKTLTQSGAFTCGDLYVHELTTNTNVCNLVMSGGAPLTAGVITL